MAVIDKYNFSGKRALIRVDFNVPMNKETLTVTDNTFKSCHKAERCV